MSDDLMELNNFDFYLAKMKKRKQREKKQNSFKSETFKRLSPGSKCFLFSHARASRIHNFFLSAMASVFHGPSTSKSISLVLS